MITEQHTPPPGQSTPPQEPAPRIEVGLLPFVGGIVGLLLAAGIIGGALFITRDGGDDESAIHTETIHTEATQPNGGLSGVPELMLEVDGEELTFTVAHDGYREGDTYEIRIAATKEKATSGEKHELPSGQTELRQSVVAGQRWCGVARVMRAEHQQSGWSRVQCEEVPR